MTNKNKIKIQILNDRFNHSYMHISFYGKYNYKQYFLKKNLLYTFFFIIRFIYNFGFIKTKNKKNVHI